MVVRHVHSSSSSNAKNNSNKQGSLDVPSSFSSDAKNNPSKQGSLDVHSSSTDLGQDSNKKSWVYRLYLFRLLLICQYWKSFLNISWIGIRAKVLQNTRLRTTLQTGCLGCFWPEVAIPDYPWNYYFGWPKSPEYFQMLFFWKIYFLNILWEIWENRFWEICQNWKIFSAHIFGCDKVFKLLKISDCLA